MGFTDPRLVYTPALSPTSPWCGCARLHCTFARMLDMSSYAANYSFTDSDSGFDASTSTRDDSSDDRLRRRGVFPLRPSVPLRQAPHPSRLSAAGGHGGIYHGTPRPAGHDGPGRSQSSIRCFGDVSVAGGGLPAAGPCGTGAAALGRSRHHPLPVGRYRRIRLYLVWSQTTDQSSDGVRRHLEKRTLLFFIILHPSLPDTTRCVGKRA